MDNIFKAILDSMEMPMLYCDINHTVQYLNPAAETYFCVTRNLPYPLGRNLLALHNTETQKKLLDFFERIKAGEGEFYISTSRIEGYRYYYMPVRRGGELIGYIERFEDGKHV